MKKILITGGGGQLALSFYSMFQNKYQIYSLSRKQLDVTNIDQIENVLQKYNPDTILHCAAMTNVDGCEKNPILAESINSLSIKKIVDVFKGDFLYISTDYVFDGSNGPYEENDTPNPINIYGKTKLLGEKMLQENSKNWTILRTNVLFDSQSEASFLSWVINSLNEEKDIEVVDDQFNNPIWVNDFSYVIDLVITKNIKGLFHIGSNKIYSRYEFAIMIAKVFGLNDRKIHPIKTEKLNQIAKRPLKSGLIFDKLSSKIEVEKIDLEKSLLCIKKEAQ